MKKQIILVAVFSLILFGFGFSGSALATQDNPVPGIKVDFKSSDLGVDSVGILPTSRWYFFKEWGRGITRIFTFGSINKAELELKIANEKAAEVLAVQEKEPGKTEALEKALVNYQKAQERLAKRIESLKETSQNPNVDELLDKLVDLSAKHIEIFDRLEVNRAIGVNEPGVNIVGPAGPAGPQGPAVLLKTTISTAKNNVFKVINIASEKDEPEKFAEKIKNAVDKLPGDELRHIRSVEMVERFIDKASPKLMKASPKLMKALGKAREEFIGKASDDVAEFVGRLKTVSGLESETEKGMFIKLGDLPGQSERHLIILDEVRQRTEEKAKVIRDNQSGRVADILSQTIRDLDKTIIEGADIKQKAEEQIKRAEGSIEKLEEALANPTTVNPSPLTQASNINTSKSQTFRILPDYGSGRAVKLFEEAQGHLVKAKDAFSQGKYGEAFGQARSAEVIARNGPRMLADIGAKEEGAPTQVLTPPAPAAPSKPVEIKPVPPALAPTVPRVSRCEELKKSLAQLDELLKTRKISGVDYNLKYESVSKELAVCEQQVSPMPAPVPTPTHPVVPRAPKPVPRPLPHPSEITKPAEGIFCPQERNPVCGADGKTYSNECMARAAGALVKHKGECAAPSTIESGAGYAPSVR